MPFSMSSIKIIHQAGNSDAAPRQIVLGPSAAAALQWTAPYPLVNGVLVRPRVFGFSGDP